MESALADLAKKAGRSGRVEVGFPEGATYPDGTSVAMVAAIQEFGSRSIPPRPFFRNMIAKHGSEWGDQLAKLLKANNYDVKATLGQMGDVIADELRDSIVDTTEPALSAVTLMLRKMLAQDPNLVITGKTVGEAAARVAAGGSVSGISTKPLIQTGHMLQSVHSEVVMEGEG